MVKIEQDAPGRILVEFSYSAADADTVALAGNFNDWDPEKYLMTRRNGVFSLTVALTPGQYEYKFVVDGKWEMDNENPRFTANDFGTLNSVFEIL